MNDASSPKFSQSAPEKLFSSDSLEWITKTRIAIPITIFVVYASAILGWSITHTALSVSVTLCLFLPVYSPLRGWSIMFIAIFST